MPEIGAEEFAVWKDNPITRWFFGAVHLMRDDIKREVLVRFYDGRPSDEDFRAHIHFLRGEDQAFNDILNVTHEDIAQAYEDAR